MKAVQSLLRLVPMRHDEGEDVQKEIRNEVNALKDRFARIFQDMGTFG